MKDPNVPADICRVASSRNRGALRRAEALSRVALVCVDAMARMQPCLARNELTAARAAGWTAEPAIRRTVTRLAVLRKRAPVLRRLLGAATGPRYFYAGQAYYNHWYLSRELRLRGAKTWLYDWDTNPASELYYHGRDERPDLSAPDARPRLAARVVDWLLGYDVFAFANAHALTFGWQVDTALGDLGWEPGAALQLARDLGKVIVYLNNGCLDGVTQTSFARWAGPESVCAVCRWRNTPAVCSDERNRAWGEFRNTHADFQMLLGGNRADYNLAPNIREVPHAYCLDPEVWHPDLPVPDEYRLASSPGQLRLFHAVGNFDERTDESGVNIKSTHHYRRIVGELKAQGYPVEFLFIPGRVPNKVLRFHQVQSDVFLDMLSFGWFGATAREAMMLGKPVICYIRPEWLEQVRVEIPDYAAELPVISATPDTAGERLRELIEQPRLRAEIGARSRRFAEKWHSSRAAAPVFERIYRQLQANTRAGRVRAPIDIYPGGVPFVR